MRSRTVLAGTSLSLVLVLAACGGDDSDGSQADADDTSPRTVEIAMVDIAFEPDTVDVEAGETVRFVFTNNGDVRHDAFIGDEAAQQAHEAEMRAAEDDMGDMDDGEAAEDEMHMDEDDEIVVEPGDTGELTYTFDEPGETLIGCHEPGHYDAGMIVAVNVS